MPLPLHGSHKLSLQFSLFQSKCKILQAAEVKRNGTGPPEINLKMKSMISKTSQRDG